MAEALGRLFSGHPARQFLAAGLLLWTVTLALHGSALSGNWRADDGDHLRFALSHEPWEYFFTPEANRAHHTASITPWNVFFYDVNLRLFGFAPKGHYAHMLLLLALSSWLLFALARQWVEWPAALAGALALLLAEPTIHIAQFLMVGHYATGLVFCLAATYGWVRYLRGGGAAWLGMGAGFYLLATLCKEVCVPLVLFLPFLGDGSWRRRLQGLLPFVGIAVAYAVWRRVVLGVFLGGSSPTGEGFDPVESLRQLASVPYLLFGQGLAGVLGVIVLAGALVLAGRDGRVPWLPGLALLAAVLLPLVPLTIQPGIRGADRYLFFPAVALAAGIAAIWPRRSDPWWSASGLWRGAIAIGLLGTLAAGHIRQNRSIGGELRRMDALYGFALRADRQTGGLFVENDPGYLMSVLSAVGTARDLFEGRPPGSKLVILTDTPAALPVLSSGAWTGRTFHRYDGSGMRPMSPGELSAAIAAQMAALRRGHEKELRVSLRHESGTLKWDFGPWEGTYQVNLEDGGVRLGRTGAYPWAEDRNLQLSVCFAGSADWVACSPRLNFDPRKRSLVWSGFGVTADTGPASTGP